MFPCFTFAEDIIRLNVNVPESPLCHINLILMVLVKQPMNLDALVALR